MLGIRSNLSLLWKKKLDLQLFTRIWSSQRFLKIIFIILVYACFIRIFVVCSVVVSPSVGLYILEFSVKVQN